MGNDWIKSSENTWPGDVVVNLENTSLYAHTNYGGHRIAQVVPSYARLLQGRRGTPLDEDIEAWLENAIREIFPGERLDCSRQREQPYGVIINPTLHTLHHCLQDFDLRELGNGGIEDFAVGLQMLRENGYAICPYAHPHQQERRQKHS
jgi:hypothetical protein